MNGRVVVFIVAAVIIIALAWMMIQDAQSVPNAQSTGQNTVEAVGTLSGALGLAVVFIIIAWLIASVASLFNRGR